MPLMLLLLLLLLVLSPFVSFALPLGGHRSSLSFSPLSPVVQLIGCLSRGVGVVIAPPV